MKRLPVLPNIITAFGLTCGLFVIFRMNMTPPGEVNLHLLSVTAGLLLLAGFADVLDGAVARMLRAESPFGGIFDSLADAITFGLAPSIIVLKTLSVPSGTPLSFFIAMAAMVYTVSGALRLARFNTMALHPKLDNEETCSKNFTGLPIPAAAVAIVSLNLFLISEEFKSFFSISEETHVWILFIAMVVVGYFMISRWKFPSLKTLRVKVASFSMVFFTVLSAVVLFFGVLNHFPVTFLLVSWGYIIVAWTLSILRLIAGRRNKALEDFEPEPEDEG